jgi:hypothetical protein
MSTIIILSAAALIVLIILVVLVSRLMVNGSAEYEAIDETPEFVYPSITSGMDARLFTQAVKAPRAVPFNAEIHTLDITPSAERIVNTEALPSITPNRLAVIDALPTMALDLAEVQIVQPPSFKTVVEADPYGKGRDPKTGRKRGANGRFIKE